MKVVLVDGLGELEKAEKNAEQVKGKFFIPHASMVFKPALRVWSAKSNVNHAVVIITGDIALICKLIPGEQVPEGSITSTYLKF